MNQGMYVAAAGGQLQMMQMDVIANNMANMNTVGYKTDGFIAKIRDAESIESGGRRFSNYIQDAVGGGVFGDRTTTDFQLGGEVTTNDPLHMYLRNTDQFFVVSGPQGNVLTRAGDFTLNNEGVLVTSDGKHQVLDEAGTPIILSAAGGPVEVSSDGTIYQGGNQVGQVMVRRIPEGEMSNLKKQGMNTFKFFGQMPTGRPAVIIHSGVIEASNVDATTEMVKMITGSRMFDLAMRMIQFGDQLLEINTQVGRPL